MGDALELIFDGVVNFLFAVPVHITPEARNAIQIFSPVVVDQIMPLAAADDHGIFPQPFLHLRERMPNIAVIQPFEFVVIGRHTNALTSSKTFSARSMCSRVCVAISVMRKRDVPGG